MLEPSFGNGIFLRAVTQSAARKGFAVRLSGVEVDVSAGARLLQDQHLGPVDVFLEDFLGIRPFPIQAVIGNPPYVRLRHLSGVQRERALDAAWMGMRQTMDPSGSLWMPFVLHAMRFLQPGGCMAFVLPYDLTYVRYARPLWDTLRSNFGSLRVLRTHERLFPELLQDVVILLADDYGSRTQTVGYEAFERVGDLLRGRAIVDESLNVAGLLSGERPFINALLGKELPDLLNTRVAALTAPAREAVTFNIGYVTGDKTFFHPTQQDIGDYQIPSPSLHPSLTSTHALRSAGLRTSCLDTSQISKLFLPGGEALTDGERRYIKAGEERGVSGRYKCRIREPWFMVPGTRVPDVILSVFSERPTLMVNDAGCFASNSLLCGYCTGATSDEIAAGWYTSLTLLQCELEVHALGGGVMVMVPGEASNIRLPTGVHAREGHLSQLSHLLRLGKTPEVYRSGDAEVLIGQLGFSEAEVALIRQGIEILAHWRTSSRSSCNEQPAYRNEDSATDADVI